MRKRELRITHSPEEGTRLWGTRRDDGAGRMLTGTWVWQRDGGCWLLVGSVGRANPDIVMVARTKRALELIQFPVRIDFQLDTLEPKENSHA